MYKHTFAEDLPATTPVTLTLGELDALIEAKIQAAMREVHLFLDADKQQGPVLIVTYPEPEDIITSQPLLSLVAHGAEAQWLDEHKTLFEKILLTFGAYAPEVTKRYAQDHADEGFQRKDWWPAEVTSHR